LVVAGGAGISGKVNINDNMDVSSCFVGGVEVSNSYRFRQRRFYVGFHDGGFYIKYIKRDERFNWIRIR
jgi:hypothetical protein